MLPLKSRRYRFHLSIFPSGAMLTYPAGGDFTRLKQTISFRLWRKSAAPRRMLGVVDGQDHMILQTGAY